MDIVLCFRPTQTMTSQTHTRVLTASAGPQVPACRRQLQRCGAIFSLACGLLSGCATGGDATLSAALIAGALPAADSLTANNPPTTVYAAIAQKALTCWMGPKGPLKTTHIFHADAASPTSGGRAEIALHERDTTQPHPWGGRTFRIELTPEGGGTDTRVAMVNIKMPKDLADAMRADVGAWAKGGESCQAQVVRPPPPESAPPVVGAKGKAKKGKSG
jgi:hypothetical protein